MAAKGRWVAVDDVAAHLRVAKDSVFYTWLNERRLPAHRVGRLFRLELSAIDEWARQGNEREKTPNSIQSRPSSKSQTNRPTAKTRSRKRGGNE
ncbi:excisionase family DNA-binding protein [Thermogutta sp.]|uniref:excisionase family DNA-binding protein n=1 Tax=Thermogutta sp. TaxID=1962930 RepID=UPI0032206ED7